MVLRYYERSLVCSLPYSFCCPSLSINVCGINIDITDGRLWIMSNVIRLESCCHFPPPTIFPSDSVLPQSPRSEPEVGGSDPSQCSIPHPTQDLLIPFTFWSHYTPVQSLQILCGLEVSSFLLVFPTQFMVTKKFFLEPDQTWHILSSDTLHGSSSPPNDFQTFIFTCKTFHNRAPFHLCSIQMFCSLAP